MPILNSESKAAHAESFLGHPPELLKESRGRLMLKIHQVYSISLVGNVVWWREQEKIIASLYAQKREVECMMEYN